MKNKLRKTYYSLRSWANLIKGSFNKTYPVSLKNRLTTIFHGFTYEKYIHYNLKENNYKDYFTDIGRSLSRFINEPHSEVLNNKLIFEKIVGSRINVARNLALLEKGKIIPLSSGVKLENSNDLLDLCKKYKGLVLKPNTGAFGKGLKIIRFRNGELNYNGKPCSAEEVFKKLRNLDNYLVTEYVQQANYSAEIFPDTTNTLRIITMRSPEDGKVFIPSALHRFGTSRTIPIDNWGDGDGACASIDVDSGIMGEVAIYSGGQSLEWISEHPETGSPIKGEKVPNWENVKNELIKTVEELPYLKYVGWDVAVTENGITVIEGNNHANPRLFQIHFPLLKNQRAREFFSYYNCL